MDEETKKLKADLLSGEILQMACASAASWIRTTTPCARPCGSGYEAAAFVREMKP